MANPAETDDVWKQVHKIYGDKYGDYVLHLVKCRSTDEALRYQSRLSFATGTTLQNMKFPSNVQPVVIQMSDYVVDVLGGQLTSDQNYEIRHLADELGIECESMCVAKAGTLTQLEFLQVMTRLKEEKTSAKKKAGSKTN